MPVTADLYIPFDAGSGANVAEAGWRAMARHWLSDGPLVTAAAPSGGLQPSPGAGRQVFVTAGEAYVQGHYGNWENQSTLNISPNTSGATRVDAVVVELDTVGNTITLDVVQGTPGAGLPVLTRTSSTWQVLIGAATIANNGTSVSVADWRVLTGPDVAGRQIGEVFELPVGDIPGWALEANNQAVSRAGYAALNAAHAAAGYPFGAGNGSSTFNVIDRRGRVPVGQNVSDADFNVIGETGGAKTHVLTQAQLPNVNVGSNNPQLHTVGGDGGLIVPISIGGPQNHRIPDAGSTSNGAYVTFSRVDTHPAHQHSLGGSGQAHNNVQPYQVTRWIVRAR